MDHNNVVNKANNLVNINSPNGAVDNRGPIAENTLIVLSKRLPKLIPGNGGAIAEDELSYLISLFQSLKNTANSPNLSLSHGAAAMNALSCFLDRASLSSVPELASLCFDLDTWESLFDIFLCRSENNKSKPVRQFLLSLVRVLVDNPDEETRCAEKVYATRSALAMILDHCESLSVKPALQVLECLLLKAVINVPNILSALAAWTQADVGSNCFQRDLDSSDTGETSRAGWTDLGQTFVFNILAWIRLPDTAAAAGKLVTTFVKSMLILHQNQADSSGDGTDLWEKPLRRLLRDQPHLLDPIGIHLLPELLKIDISDTRSFLRSLPVEQLYDGDFGDVADLDIKLCLIAIDVVVRMKPHDMSSILQGSDIRLHTEKVIAPNLLEHPSPDIRIRALSSTLRSSSTTALTTQVLVLLRSSITHFHKEVEAKSRNEFIALAQSLMTRIMRAGWSAQDAAASCRRVLVENQRNNFDKLSVDKLEGMKHTLTLNQEIYKQHSTFFKFYVDFLAKELQPTASYQRHITALQILSFIITFDLKRCTSPCRAIDSFDQDAGWPGQEPYTRALLRPLFDLIMDPFDDVRNTANVVLTTILEKVWNPCLDTSKTELSYDLLRSETRQKRKDDHLDLSKLFHLAQITLYATGRADHADGVARISRLTWQSCGRRGNWHASKTIMIETTCIELEKDIAIARSELNLAACNMPLHGHLIALRYVISTVQFYDITSTGAPVGTWENLKERIISACTSVWEAVKGTLCHDSPEGYSFNIQDLENLDIGLKDTLSFSWRALKESSLLLHALLQAGPRDRNFEIAFSHSDLQMIGGLSFTQLAELRHRGAFSTVSRTFALCCAKCVQIELSGINKLPERWYSDVLSYIQQNASALTRRSAGIPAMVTGVLAAHVGLTLFDSIILDLQAIADMSIDESADVEEPHLPQVHALNCLKDVFADTRLGSSTELHVADSLEIATSCLESKIWAIRNAGLMLFNSLLRRIHGGSDVNTQSNPDTRRMHSSKAYERYPNLPSLVVRLLRVASFSRRRQTQANLKEISTWVVITAQRIFPALEIIARSGLPLNHRNEIVNLIQYHMCSPVWSLREKAAGTLALVVREEDIASEVDRLLQPDWGSYNALHGRLLCARHLMTRLASPRRVETFGDSQSDLRLLTMFRSDEEGGRFSLEGFKTQITMFLTTSRCPITAAVYLEILNDILGSLIQSKSRFASYFGLILQKHVFKEWRGTDIDKPLHRSAPKATLSLESLNQFITRGGRDTNVDDSPDESGSGPASTLQLVALERCADLVKEACGGSLSSELIDELDSKRFSDTYQTFPWDNPHSSDDALRSHGRLIGIAYSGNLQNAVLEKNMTAWMCKLVLAGDDRSELFTRLAAVQSIDGFLTSHWRFSQKTTSSSALLGVYLALWDAVVDDDEEIRDLAAGVISQVVSRSSSAGSVATKRHVPLSPAAARPRMMRFFEKEYAQSSQLWSEAIFRLIGLPSSQRTVLRNDITSGSRLILPFATMMEQARTPDTALFVEEKQNLYFDKVEEARCWAHALSESRYPDMADLLRPTLSIWTTDGLGILADAVTSEEDGPFGWTSKPEVFTLGMRVIFASKVLVSHGIEVNTCETHLQDIFQQHVKSQLHDLWVVEVLDVLQTVQGLKSPGSVPTTPEC